MLDKIRPELHRGGGCVAAGFPVEPFDRGSERATVKRSQHRSAGVHDRQGTFRFLIANPGNVPGEAWHRFVGVKRMWGSQAGVGVGHRLPTAFQPDAALATVADHDEGSAEMRPLDLVRMYRFGHAHMHNAVRHERGANGRADEPVALILAVCANDAFDGRGIFHRRHRRDQRMGGIAGAARTENPKSENPTTLISPIPSVGGSPP